MHAKIILVALAAVCCVQGIAAAAVRPAVEKELPEFDLDNIDLDNFDVDAAADALLSIVEEIQDLIASHEDEVKFSNYGATQVRAPKNIFNCITSIIAVFKDIKEAFGLVGEFKKAKADYKDAEEKCLTPPEGQTTETCNEAATTAYNKAVSDAKAKIWPAVVKGAMTLMSLKNCASFV